MQQTSTEQAISQRLPYFGIGEADHARFPRIGRAIGRFAPNALKRFYDKIKVTPDAARHFSSPAHMDTARSKQLEHWRQLFSGRVDAAYFAKGEQIGTIHARIGLEPTWYIGGYAMVLEEVVAKMIRHSPGGLLDGGRTASAVGSLIKCALLDMDIALSAYFKAEEASRLEVIAKLADSLASVAAGNFATRLEGLPPAFAKIEADFEGMRRQIGEALGEVAQTAGSVSTGAAEIGQASGNLAMRTEQQAANLEETAAAMDLLASGVKNLADGAAEVRESVVQAQELAVEGGAEVKQAVLAMDDIERSAREIGKIVDVIDGIAFQTNLLALNAGVEAARAGDAGKGFAVVANEVRALAQRSADAARDIKELIKSSTTQVERGVGLVGRSGDVFERIISQVRAIAGLASTISELSSTQAGNLHQVNGAVREMDQMTQQNAAMVEQSTAAARSLANEAEGLEQLVARFRLDTGRRGAQHPATGAGRPRIVSRTEGALALNVDEQEWAEF